MNPIKGTFATVPHRTIRSKGCLSKKTALPMALTAKSICQTNQGAKVTDAIEVVGDCAAPQAQAAG
jgi:nicotinamide mononucleotide (NMN) deamidase PncC